MGTDKFWDRWIVDIQHAKGLTYRTAVCWPLVEVFIVGSDERVNPENGSEQVASHYREKKE